MNVLIDESLSKGSSISLLRSTMMHYTWLTWASPAGPTTGFWPLPNVRVASS